MGWSLLKLPKPSGEPCGQLADRSAIGTVDLEHRNTDLRDLVEVRRRSDVYGLACKKSGNERVAELTHRVVLGHVVQTPRRRFAPHLCLQKSV